MMITVYGIPNCDTIKKTTNWLKENQIEFEFHNYKTMGITQVLLKKWMQQVSWEVLLNKKGTTWKKLSETEQQSATNAKNVAALLSTHTSMIKRPVITVNEEVKVVGFVEEELLKLKAAM